MINFKLASRGSSSVELAMITPFVLMFCLIIIQIFTAIFSATSDVESASIAVKRRLRIWQDVNSNQGLKRPCIEKLKPNFESISSPPVKIGFGKKSLNVSSKQVVRITNEDICTDN